MTNRVGTCVECGCDVREKRWPGHVNWHVQLVATICRAAGMSDVFVERQRAATRLHMEGKFSAVI